MGILTDAYERTSRGEQILMMPEQYSTQLGLPLNETQLHIRYLIDGLWLSGTIETMTGRLVISQVRSITKKGIEAVERGWLDSPSKPSGTPGTTVNINAPIVGSNVAIGNNNQQKVSTISTFQEAYSYSEARLSKEHFEEIMPLLKEVEAQKGDLTVSKLNRIREALERFGRVAGPLLDFVLRVTGSKA
jgi:hypothetical protein